MRNYCILLMVVIVTTACRYDFPIISGYFITSDPAMSQSYNSNFGYLLFTKDYTEYIAGDIKHVYYNDKILVAMQDSLTYTTWYIIQPKKYTLLNGPWDDSIEGPLTTRQRDSILQGLSIRLEDLRHNDYTTWRYPRD